MAASLITLLKIKAGLIVRNIAGLSFIIISTYSTTTRHILGERYYCYCWTLGVR